MGRTTFEDATLIPPLYSESIEKEPISYGPVGRKTGELEPPFPLASVSVETFGQGAAVTGDLGWPSEHPIIIEATLNGGSMEVRGLRPT